MKKIAPSILSADFNQLGDEIKAVEEAGADMIHVDVMDGHFVPNITIGPAVVRSIRKITALPLDCHLMIQEPDKFIEEFAEAGADMISVHAEVCPDIRKTVLKIREMGKRAGVVLNPSSPVSMIEEYLPILDYVLMMSVNPGFSGQKFIPLVLSKVKEVRRIANEKNLRLNIQIDGGINTDTIQQASIAGANIFVAGNAIFKADNYVSAMAELRRLIR